MKLGQLMDLVTSSKFDEFWNDDDIKEEIYYCIYSSSKWSSIEGEYNQKNMMKIMLFEKNTHKEFWLEIVKWSVFVQNRSPTMAVKYATPKKCEVELNQQFISLESLVVLVMCML